MMINKRLIGMVSESRPRIAASVGLQWAALLGNLATMGLIAWAIDRLAAGRGLPGVGFWLALAGAAAVRMACTEAAARMAHKASRAVKLALRRQIYAKLLRLGPAYRQQVNTAEVVQAAVEGVDQLESYFGAYLPQFFYSMLAPLTLFAVLAPVCLPAAAALLICVPLIPAAIAAVQTWAKKLLSKYWGQYTALGDSFLENLQGLTTLKIYSADERRNEEMNREAEQFRRITMRVLTMQLNSISIMDLVAFGGAALGIGLAVSQYTAGRLSLGDCVLVLLLSADFFLPMRQLGSYFHIAMNGMAASDRIFRLLDMPEPPAGGKPVPADTAIRCQDLRFGYEPGREILRGVDLDLPRGGFVALVGESGCGKSTLAALLTGRVKGWQGQVTMGGVPLEELDETGLLRTVTCLGHNAWLCKGTLADNLRLGAPDATDEQLWNALKRAKLDGFARQAGGLDAPVAERGANLSGGQRQRLALARALLQDSPVYIFDEATSNIDAESENDIMSEIHRLARTRTVLLISHRLANAAGADRIYVLENGRVAQQGRHAELLAAGGLYARLWNTQQELEHEGEKEAACL
ncbi:ABC transporter ATP-binding protein/permease [Gemmiger formicilis]|nr:ABC transporter ATP-binding protein/permease [Gemmiger formicilis]MBM6916097.1 ABC transporter ATP-binding protein/permease [Gemmiger formicilis]